MWLLALRKATVAMSATHRRLLTAFSVLNRWWYVTALIAVGLIYVVWIRKPALPPSQGQYLPGPPPAPAPSATPQPLPTPAGQGPSPIVLQPQPRRPSPAPVLQPETFPEFEGIAPPPPGPPPLATPPFATVRGYRPPLMDR